MFGDFILKAKEGGTPSTSVLSNYEDGTIPWANVDDLVEKDLFFVKGVITDKGLRSSSAWLVPPNSILYSNAATIGNISINRVPMTTKQGILGIIPDQNVNTEYLYYLMQSTTFKKKIKRITTIGTIQSAYYKDISKDIEICVPCYEKQNSIVQILNTIYTKRKISNDYLFELEKMKKVLQIQLFI